MKTWFCTHLFFFFRNHATGFELHFSVKPLSTPICTEPKWMQRTDVSVWHGVASHLWCHQGDDTHWEPKRGNNDVTHIRLHIFPQGALQLGRRDEAVALTTNHHCLLSSCCYVAGLNWPEVMQEHAAVNKPSSPTWLCECQSVDGACIWTAVMICCVVFLNRNNTSLLRAYWILAPLSLWPEHKGGNIWWMPHTSPGLRPAELIEDRWRKGSKSPAGWW